MKYTFLLPAFKARFFEEALGSILAQTYCDFEVIVSDDCSPEDLKSIVDKFADPRVKYRRNEKNIGAEHLVDHWNLLLGLTDAEYIIMASDDDVYDPRYLEEMDRLARKYPEANVVRPLIRIINAEGRTTFEEQYPGKERLDVNEFLELWGTERLMSGVPYYVFKAEALKKSGGFVDYPYAHFSDDATVVSGIIGYNLVISDRISFSFRQSGANISYATKREDKYKKVAVSIHFCRMLKTLNIARQSREFADDRIFKVARDLLGSCKGNLPLLLKTILNPAMPFNLKQRIILLSDYIEAL